MSEGRLRDDRDAASDIARKLVSKGADLRFLEGEEHTRLATAEYGPLRHRIEDPHAAVEAAAVEARRRVRLDRAGSVRETHRGVYALDEWSMTTRTGGSFRSSRRSVEVAPTNSSTEGPHGSTPPTEAH